MPKPHCVCVCVRERACARVHACTLVLRGGRGGGREEREEEGEWREQVREQKQSDLMYLYFECKHIVLIQERL